MNRKRGATDGQDGEPPSGAASTGTRLETVAKPLLAVAGLVVAGGLLGLVPTLDAGLPGAPVSLETALVGVLAVVAFGLFVAAATKLEVVVAERLSDRGDLAAAAGTIAKYLVVFLGLVGAYAPVTRALYPFLKGTDAAGLFDLGFTVAALALLAAVGVVVYRHLDDLTALVVAHVAPGSVDEPVTTGAGGARGPADGERIEP